MSGITKWIIGAVLVIFALIGIKSLFAPNPAEAPPSASGWEQPLVMPNANLPSPDAIGDKSIFTRPLNDKPVETEDNTIELVGEPEDKEDTTETVPTTPPKPTTPAPVATTPDDNLPPDEVTTALPTPPTPTPAPAPAPPVIGKTGTLEIVTQTETGKPIKANVYVQQANGVNLDKAMYTNKAAFTLKPGKYKITVRAEGYASLSRTISVPDGAVVNEIFPLPALAAAPAPVAQPPRQPVPAPVTQTPPATPSGKLRVVALAADDGSPLPVNFTIARLDGTVVERANNVSLTELTLPAQEFVVSFEYQGFQGYKSLTVQAGQTLTHTFNIRGVNGEQPQAAMPPSEIPPAQQPQQQPNIEDLIMQKLQEELQKRLTN
ncbi:PEGA domain-containing protein [Thiothrix caldifontis]|uniref:PEGA domain-containing protein n=1 Tax=Thiothrix caldifontis TaxID=525918 RepID=A0A1H3W582_9GAMM|nr:PEGA domain-containing protein [Thiothrix caldifontis]SDZ82216.1 PEGA domain-containing protein [Thiothrix caldifontis]